MTEYAAWLLEDPGVQPFYTEDVVHLTDWPRFPFSAVPAQAGTAGPSSLSINGGATTTDDNDVVLSLSSVIGGEAPGKMRFREGDGSWTELEPYAANRDWQLAPATSESEERTVTAEFVK